MARQALRHVPTIGTFLMHERIFVPDESVVIERMGNLKRYGFSADEVRKIVMKFPAVLACTAERTNVLLGNLERYGFSADNVRGIVMKFPAMLGYTAERTNEVMRWHDKHGISWEDKPYRLIFSTATLEERSCFLASIRHDCRKNAAPLFYSKKQWEAFVAAH